MKHFRAWLFVLVACAFGASGVQASFHLFVIDQVFSNSDGTVQYVVMREGSGANGEHLWSGHPISTTNASGVSKQMTFTTNLPSSTTAGRSVLIGTPGFAALGL